MSGGMSKCFKHRRSAGEDHRRIRWLLHSLPPNRFSQRRRNVASSRPLNASRKESELRLSGLRRKKLRPSANRRQRASGKRLPRQQHSGFPGGTRRAPRRIVRRGEETHGGPSREGRRQGCEEEMILGALGQQDFKLLDGGMPRKRFGEAHSPQSARN